MRCPQIFRAALSTALTVLVMASIGMNPARAAAFVVDDFTDGVATKAGRGLEQKAKGRMARDDGNALRGVLGGTRQVVLRFDNGPGASEECNLAIDRSVNGLSYSSSGRADCALELTYGAAGRGLRTDLSSMRGISVVVDADSSSLPYTVTLTLRDSANRSTTTAQTVTRSGAQQIDLLFGSSGSVNIKKIDRVGIVIDPPAAADLVVRRVETLASGVGGH
jgi:hypothetical protein